jgi:hypothetical protein
MTLSPNVFVSSTLAVGSGSASSGAINIVAGAGLGLGIWSRAATSEVQLLASESHNFAALGGTGARGSVMLGITSSGPPTILTLQSGFFCILRDTAASTTRFYYNNGGTITSSAAFL